MLQPGISAEVKFVVTDELTAKTVGSGTWTCWPPP